MRRFGAAQRRLAVGLSLALALALGLEYWILARARSTVARVEVERQAITSVEALADLVGRAGGSGDAVRTLVERFAAASPGLASVRVTNVGSLSLEASTAPQDRGEKAAPRRLARDEKPLFDQAQRLRAAIQTNRQEGVYRKEEVEAEPTAAGGLSIAVPVASGGEVVGSVLAATVPLPAAPRPSPLSAALFFLAAGALFLLVAVAVGERRLLLTVLGVLLLVAGAAGYAAVGFAGVAAARQAENEAVASHVVATAALASRVAGEAGLAVGALDPASWDVDRYRRPRELVTARGAVDQPHLAAELGRARGRLVRTVAGLLGVGLALLLFIGLGGAHRLGVTLARNRHAYFYVVPAMVGMVVLVFFPFLYGIALSFTDSNLYNTEKPLSEIWVGFDNYTDILGDVSVVKRSDEGFAYDFENFYWTLGFTVIWTAANVTFGVTVGLALALILNTRGLFLRPLYRVLLILPWAVPNYITALIWRGMFHQQFGVINQVVQLLGGHAISWFESPFTSFVAVLSTNGWLSFPFMMVISLGALQSIPSDLYEAARVDGADRWQQFRAITLPSLRPALVPAVILSVIWTFNMFNVIYLTSGGEPAHSTEILITEAYKIAFEKYQYGYAAAYSTIIFIILLVYGTWQNRVTRATEAIG